MSLPAYVAICTPVYDTYDPRFIRALRVLDVPGQEGMVLEAHGQLLDDARRNLTIQALAQERVTHILWADADMTFPPDALARLLDHELPIVGALCFERRPPYNPTINVGGNLLWDYPRDTLVRVDSTGGGFLLTERQVYESIAARFGARSWWISRNDGDLGETFAGDESFLWRAKQCGFEVHVDTSVKTGHVAKVIVDEAFVDRWRKGGAK